MKKCALDIVRIHQMIIHLNPLSRPRIKIAKDSVPFGKVAVSKDKGYCQEKIVCRGYPEKSSGIELQPTSGLRHGFPIVSGCYIRCHEKAADDHEKINGSLGGQECILSILPI